MNQLEVKLSRNHLHSIWFCVKTVIDKDIPDTPQDEAFLMSLLSRIAEQDKETTDDFKLKLTFQEMRAAWFCCQIVHDNQLYKSLEQDGVILQSYSLLAPALDQHIAMDTPPDQLPPPPKDEIVFNPPKKKNSLILIHGE